MARRRYFRPGIPTMVKARRYRSRLEARWSTFFDLLGWPHEYEPFDLNGWIPDFLLLGDTKVLVEIKPDSEFPQDVRQKIEEAEVLPDFDVLILGCAIPIWKPFEENRLAFGWLAERSYRNDPFDEDDPWDAFDWGLAILGRWEDGEGRIGFCHSVQDYTDRISGGHDGVHGELPLCPSEVKKLWAEAGNLVQWRAPH